MDIIIIQFSLGILLFFIINWIGKHSYSIGYMEISMFLKTEEAPALNYMIRVLTPIVYLVICSSILYYFDLDKYVKNIFLVNLYYIMFRLTFNLLTNRGMLINWKRQILYWLSILSISYILYEKIIKIKTNILPDFTSIANELWIIILVFIFQLANNFRFSSEDTIKRKEKYLSKRYSYFKRIYGEIIRKKTTKTNFLEPVIYGILIYEDFNRPKIIRVFENLKQRITRKPHTLGVMQVKTKKIITDFESVKKGSEKVLDSYRSYCDEMAKRGEEIYEHEAKYRIVQQYNGGTKYVNEVCELIYIIEDKFYN